MDLAAELEPHRPHLWSLCYRLTGDASEAEDIVQDAFARAIRDDGQTRVQQPRAWLTRIASRLAIDVLRRRQHDGYTGPWLPSPVANEALLQLETTSYEGADADHRIDVMQSASSAFLRLMEQLEPRARIVLVLSDVAGLRAPEVAEILQLSAANVRQILGRARNQLARSRPTEVPDTARHDKSALEALVAALMAGDMLRLTELLAEDVEFHSDGGGEFRAALRVVQGRGPVAQLLDGLVKKSPTPSWWAIVELNGAPAFVCRYPEHSGDARQAKRIVLTLELDPSGRRVQQLGLVAASRKLAAIDFSQPPPGASTMGERASKPGTKP